MHVVPFILATALLSHYGAQALYLSIRHTSRSLPRILVRLSSHRNRSKWLFNQNSYNAMVASVQDMDNANSGPAPASILPRYKDSLFDKTAIYFLSFFLARSAPPSQASLISNRRVVFPGMVYADFVNLTKVRNSYPIFCWVLASLDLATTCIQV